MPKRLSKKEVEEGLRFVLSERTRHQQMRGPELIQNLKENFFYELRGPGGNLLPIGRAAALRFDHIADEALAINRLQNTVSRATMREILSSEFINRFLVQGREIDTRQTDRLLSWAGREAARKCAPKIHFIPCHLMYQPEPEELIVGPIILRTRPNFYRRLKSEFRTYAPKAGPTTNRTFLKSAVQYYRAFRWIAEVPVTAADDETSRKIALDSARAMLNGINIVFGAGYTSKMLVGGPRITIDRRGHFHLDETGQLNLNISVTGPGQVNFAKGWSKDFEASDLRRFLDYVGEALEVAVNSNLSRPISLRIVDALHWFGEGVRETSDAARIVKFATALERTLMTSEHDDIEKYVSERCAAFCWIGDPSKPLLEWTAEAKKLYNLRSRLVHGDLSPLAPEIAEGVGQAANLVRFTILSVLNHFYAQSGLKAKEVSNKGLARWFDHHVALSKELAP